MAELPIVVQILSPLKETECDFVPENCITTVSVGSVFFSAVNLFTFTSRHQSCGKPCVTLPSSVYFKLCIDSSVCKDAFLRHGVMCGVVVGFWKE